MLVRRERDHGPAVLFGARKIPRLVAERGSGWLQVHGNRVMDSRVDAGVLQVRAYVRGCDEGELQWRQLQGLVYGARIADATVVEGVGEFFDLCRRRGVATYIVSHKTSMSEYVDPPVDLRAAALQWMTSRGFFREDGFGLRPQDVFFASSRNEKIEQIRALGCTHFIDDLEEVLLDPEFPVSVERLLFAPARTADAAAPLPTFTSWRGICAHLFERHR